MRQFFTITAALLLFTVAFVRAQSFGNAPKDKAAQAMGARVAETYKAQGMKPALQLLDSEGRAFIKKSGATARYDFFAALSDESWRGKGRVDQDWSIALTEWCYVYCRTVGDDYWFRKFANDLHIRYFEAGKYGAARAVIDFEQARELERGIELDVQQFPIKGVVNPEFPAIAKRGPGKLESIENKSMRYFIARAEQDMAEGKWRPAMEAAFLLVEQNMGNYNWHKARPELTDSKVLMTDTTGHWRKVRTVMANGYRFLDLPELELKELEALSQFNLLEGRGLFEVQVAKARLLHLNYLLGKQDASVLKAISEIRELQLSEEYQALADADRVYLMMADVNFREGNTKRGWEIIDEIRAKKDLSRDMKYEVDMEWCRHRVQTAAYEGVEDVLVNLLKIAREGGLKQREIALYEIYARLLIGLERFEDAQVIQGELMRLLKSFDLFTRIPSALHQLARIQALMGERDAATASLSEARHRLDAAKIPEAVKARLRAIIGTALPDASANYKAVSDSTDLQPMRSLSIPLAGLPARGLFTLTNLSGNAVEGEIFFQGKGLVLHDSAGATITLDVAEPSGKEAVSRKVTLPAGSFFGIDIARQATAGDQQTAVAIQWKPSIGKPQTAEWKAEQAEDGISIAITDAAEYLDNPFYLIPIYHLLQYKDPFAQAADIRVVASQPSRIELYNQNDELVFVDADGDGAFTSEGDIISKDLNRNGIGDMTLSDETQELRFRLFVRPAQIVAGKEVSLNLQMFQAGEWITYSTDKLIFPVVEK